VKTRIKRLLGARGLRLMERLGRIRFDRKLKNLRRDGIGFRSAPVPYLSYLLFDPELHSYSFELANRDELIRFAAETFGIDEARAATLIAETDGDPELNRELARRVRWRFDYKRRLPLGNRLLWWVLIRATKPRVVAETGIYDGLGSLVVLRALERNADEGAEGRLISFDLDPDTGWLVPERLHRRWKRVTGPLEETLEPTLREAGVDLLIHDSDHNEPLQRLEFGTALANARYDVLWIIDSSGVTLPVLRDLCAERDGTHRYFKERPKRHFYRTEGTLVARFELGR
jgi:Methyltransferase domain